VVETLEEMATKPAPTAPATFAFASVPRSRMAARKKTTRANSPKISSARIPLAEVSKLLGHSNIKTTEKSYAPWVQERQDRLDSLVVATWQ